MHDVVNITSPIELLCSSGIILSGGFGLLYLAIMLSRCIRSFDRKMVAAGQQRQIETEARAAAAATAGRRGRLETIRAPDGTVQYAVQLEGDVTTYRLVIDSGASAGEVLRFRLLSS